MTTLRVIVDDLVAPDSGSLRPYVRHLTSALIARAPGGVDVVAVVAASPEDDYALIHDALPGLARLAKSALGRRELAAAWRRGLTPIPGTGMIHAPSPVAPLRRHDRELSRDSQTVVTFHDTLAWTHPDALPRGVAAAQRALGARAERFADAVVATSHATAAELSGRLRLGDRVRVIEPAPAPTAEDAIDTPSVLLCVTESGQTPGVEDFLALARDDRVADLEPTLIVRRRIPGVDAPDGIRLVESPTESELDGWYARASVYVQPDSAGGLPQGMLDALARGIPVVHRDAPASVELSAGAGLEVRAEDDLADAVASLRDDPARRAQMRVRGQDRAAAYSWSGCADEVWRLHAEL